jgi:hypothetical protein
MLAYVILLDHDEAAPDNLARHAWETYLLAQ